MIDMNKPIFWERICINIFKQFIETKLATVSFLTRRNCKGRKSRVMPFTTFRLRWQLAGGFSNQGIAISLAGHKMNEDFLAFVSI